jgi:purine-nucleoside phosphorylase
MRPIAEATEAEMDDRLDASDLEGQVEEARAYLAAKIPWAVRTSLTLGSGLGPVRSAFQTVRAFPYGEIPHFPVSTVVGHRGELVVAKHAGRHLIILDGRVHCYEGYSWRQVTFPVRVLHALGITTAILTNASGAVSRRLCPGDIMLIDDHIDLIWKGVSGLSTGPQAMRRPYYSRRLTDLAEEVARARGIPARRGVLLASTGPAYETRREVEFARQMGADSVTMSTVPEVTVCHQLGVSAIGMSLITNVAAAHEGGHAKVVGFAETASRNLREIVLGVLEAIARPAAGALKPSRPGKPAGRVKRSK